MADKEESESTESTSGDDAARRPEPTDETTTEPDDEPDYEPDYGSDATGDDEREPEPVGAGATTRAGAGAASSSLSKASRPQKKDRPTAKRDTGEAEPKRTGPVTFVKESVAELRKVVYPTGPQLLNYFIVVLIFVLFIIAYVSLLDLGLGAAIFRIFS